MQKSVEVKNLSNLKKKIYEKDKELSNLIDYL